MFSSRSGRLELLRTAHAGEFDRPKTGNYDSDRPVTDCGRLDINPAFLIGGRLIGASLVVMSLKDGGGLYMEVFSRNRAEEAFST